MKTLICVCVLYHLIGTIAGNDPAPFDVRIDEGPEGDEGAEIETEICTLEPDPGYCVLKIPSFYFHEATRSCMTFQYTGCDGNENRFDTEDACVKACGHRSSAVPIGFAPLPIYTERYSKEVPEVEWAKDELITSETAIKTRNKITTLQSIGKEYKIELEFRPVNTNTKWGNIVQFTTGGRNKAKYGFHAPTVFYHGKKKSLIVFSAVNGKTNFFSRTRITPDKWHKLEISQEKQDGKYYYKVVVDGKQIKKTVNRRTKEFNKMTVYAAPPWYKAQSGSIRKLDFHRKEFYEIGCYRDHWQRAIIGQVTKYYSDSVIEDCHDRAKEERNEYFAVRYGVQCVTSLDAGQTYNRYGKSKACRNGRGGHFLMTVYKVSKVTGPCQDKYKWCKIVDKGWCRNQKARTFRHVRNVCRKSCKICADGQWGAWPSTFGKCSKDCGDGIKTKTRKCNNPAPLNGGLECVGSATEEAPCKLKECPVHGQWSEWSAPWSEVECSKPCGEGVQTRDRECNNPAPKYGGNACEGDAVEVKECKIKECPVHGQWGEWNVNAGACSKTCGKGVKMPTRECNNPAPMYGGNECEGEAVEVRVCKVKECPVHGKWSEWPSEWSACSTTCSVGIQFRFRKCSNPAPLHGGKECEGDAIGVQPCNDGACPVHGKWGEWPSEWSACSKTCVRTRSRECDSPSPFLGGNECEGDATGVQSCKEGCPVNGKWGDWSKFGTCSKTCGEGKKKRTRECNNPAPVYGGETCSGSAEDVQPCKVKRCPVPCKDKSSTCPKLSTFCESAGVGRHCRVTCGLCNKEYL